MLESGRHLHGGEGAHIPFPNPSFGSECPRQFFFVVAAEDVLDQQLLLLKRLQNHLLQLLADLLYVVLVLFAEDVVLSQIPFHSFGVGEASQRTPEQHTVETGHHSLYIFLELGDKPLHGVLFLRYAWWNWILQQRITWIERQHRLRLAAMRGMASARAIRSSLKSGVDGLTDATSNSGPAAPKNRACDEHGEHPDRKSTCNHSVYFVRSGLTCQSGILDSWTAP